MTCLAIRGLVWAASGLLGALYPLRVITNKRQWWGY